MKHTSKKLLSMLLTLSMLAGTFATTAMAAPSASGDAEVTDLRVEDLVAPVGIDNPNPVFSWKMKSDAIGAAQTAYSIKVTSEDGTTMWDTGWLANDKSVGIAYQGTALQASTEYTVSVAIKDENGDATDAVTTTFETGLMSEDPFADAQWISYQDTVISTETTYTIDFDFEIAADAQGLCFGMQNSSNFIMWQVNSKDNATKDKAVLLRPHFQENGTWTGYPGLAGSNVKAVDVTEAIGHNTDTVNGKVIHERIEVDGTTIKTYFGADAENLTLADTYTHTKEIPLYNIGFRCASGEHSYIDNLVVKGGNGEVIYSNDFEESVSLSGTNWGIESGRLHVPNRNDVGQINMIMTGNGGNSLPAYRKSFTPAKALKSAKLYTSGLGVYESYINGERVGRKMDDGTVEYDELKPGFTEPSDRVFYNSYDVTWMLESGKENVLSSVVSSGWWSGQVAAYYGKTTAYMAKLILTYDDGTTETIVTDTSWKTAKAAKLQEGTAIFNGERYDARVDESWMLPGYEDKTWGNVRINNEFKGDITAWSGVPIKVREDLERTPVEMYVFEGATGAGTGYHGTVNKLAEYQDGDTITVNPGETLLVDFGQNLAGWECFDIQAEAGTTVNVEHGEMLNDGNGATSRGNDGPEGSIYNANYRSASANTVYITSGEANETYHASHSFYGFRYIELTADKTVTFTNLTAQVVTSSLEDTGDIVTSDKDINQLVSNVRWGMYSNYLSVPTDCPQRDERQGWAADTQNFAEAGMFLGNSKSFLEKFMLDMRDSQNAQGAYCSTAPVGIYGGSSFGQIGWADAGIIVPYFLYVMYGDVSSIQENWDSMVQYMDVFMASTNKKGGGHNYGDWLAYEANDTQIKNMLGVSYFAWDAQLMAIMADAIGDEAAVAKYNAVYEEEKAYFQEQFVNANGTLVRGEQTVCLYALFLDLLPNEESVAAVTEQLISNIERNGNKLQTGFLGTEIIMYTLTKIGRSDVAYKLLLQHDNPSWLYSVDQGATTIWERWNSYTLARGFGDVGMNSFNHYSYGSVAAWMFRGMAGISYDLENPGFKHIILTPSPDQLLKDVKATYNSAYGTIVSDMSYSGTTWNYACTVPANTTATINLPVEKIDTLTVNGHAVSALTEAEGLTYVGYENGIATFEAVAGSFTFSTNVTLKQYVKINVTAPSDMPPVAAAVTKNGEVVSNSMNLPTTLTVAVGDEITVRAIPVNYVDYEVTGWSKDGEPVGEGDTLTFTVDGDSEYTVNAAMKNQLNLAQGKRVMATQVNATWKTSNLTDGILCHLGGTNGWSSSSNGKTNVFASPCEAVIDLGTVEVFDELRIYPRNDNYPNVYCFPVTYKYYVSDDNSTWTEVASIVDGEVPDGYVPAVTKLENAVSGRYVKLSVTKTNSTDDYNDGYVQLSEMVVINSSKTDVCTVNVNMVAEKNAVPANVKLLVNGDAVATSLPATLHAEKGDKITAVVELYNDVDFAVKNWTVGETVVSESDLDYTVTGDASITLNIKWNGYDSLATGKPVLAEAVNADWAGTNLTDGKLSYLDGSNGWSSVQVGKNITTFDEVSAVIDMGESTAFDRIHLYPRNLPSELEEIGVMNCPSAYTIYVSDDNSTWTPVYTTTEGTVTNGFAPVVIELEQAVSGRYVKLGVTAVNQGDEHGSVYVQVSELGLYLTTPVEEEEKDVQLIVTGEAESNLFAESMTYTVSGKDMKKLGNVKVEIAVSEATLAEPKATAAEGWMIIAQSYENGVLTVIAGNLTGANGEGAIMTIAAKPAGETGDATMTITRALAAVYTEEAEKYVDVNLDGASFTTTVVYSQYDVNHDGVVDQLDLTRAQRYYGKANATCDVNNDGTVNIEDLILIVNNYTEPF